MGGPSHSAESKQAASASSQSTTAQDISGELFGEAQGALVPAINYFKELAGGNPQAITRAIAPSIAQASANEESAKRSIEASVPRGGAEQLALAELPIQTAATVSQEANRAYTGAFPSLANLALGIQSQAEGEQGLALGATQTAAQAYGQISEQQAQGKASTMGFMGSLVGAGAELGSAAILA